MSEFYRKKPVLIEAWQIDSSDYDEMCDIIEWCGGTAVGEDEDNGKHVIAIDTLEGRMYADPGDWIIKGVHGEFYPCKPDIFDKTYDPPAPTKTQDERVFNAVRDIIERLEPPRFYAGDWPGDQARRILQAIEDAS